MIQKHRIATLTIILAFVTVVAAVSWLLGAQIQSPAEAAARTAPPEPSPILVPVETRLLTSDIVARGTARYGLPKTVTLVPSMRKGAPGIITTLPERGVQLQEGDLLLTASERPVFLLQGEVPVYRDLTIGVDGKDVQQLERALQRLGYDPGQLDGLFDEVTAKAVTSWYAAAGWQPAPPTSNELAEITRLRAVLSTARNELAAAEDAVATAPLQVDRAEANAEHANQVAAALLAQKEAIHAALTARADAATTEIAVATAELSAAQAAATATKLGGEAAILDAQRAQARATREMVAAQEMVERLTAELAAVERPMTGYVPADELVFVPTLPVRIERLQADIGDPAQGAVLMVTNNQLAIDSQLPLGEASLVQSGMTVAIDEPELGIEAVGTVARVADSPGTDGVDGYHVYFETRVAESVTDINGFSVRLTIPVESTDGAVTVVPISALSLRADGKSVVEVANNSAFETVVVEPGLAADGMVAVTPVDGELLPGQLVVVGYEAPE